MEKKGEIILRIARREAYSGSDEHCILKSFQKRFGDEFSLLFSYVDSIPRSSRGKYQFLIQKLPIRFAP